MLEYVIQNMDLIISLTIDHISIYLFSISLAIVVGLLLGIMTAKFEKLSFISAIANFAQATPDLVFLALAVILIGLGNKAAIAALFVKGVLPILRNTYSGIVTLDPNIIESAKGMGMSDTQILFSIEIPLALPVILAGIRIASVMAVSVLTLSAYIGVNSLGMLISQGIAMSDTNALLTGSIATSLLAILLNYLILFFEKRIVAVR